MPHLDGKLGKLKTGEFLLSIGVIHHHNQALCKFCGMSLESINHAFLHCPYVWFVWCLILEWRGMQWVTPMNVELLILWWVSCKMKPIIKKIWNCIPFAVLWSIWKMRNEFIFQKKLSTGKNWWSLPR